MKRLIVLVFFSFLYTAQGQPSVPDTSAEEVRNLSITYQARANWFRSMPHFSHDSTVYYFAKGINLLQTHSPIQSDRLASIFADMVRPEYRSYSYTTMDSLAQVGWQYFQQVPPEQREDMLEYNLLSYRTAVKLERTEIREALKLFARAMAVVQNDTRPQVQARVLKDKGNFYVRNYSSQDWDLVLASARESLHLYKSFKNTDPETLIQVYRLFQQVYDQRNMEDSSLYYLDILKSLLSQSKNPYNYAWYYALYGRNLITYAQIQGGKTKVDEAKMEEGRLNILKAISTLDTYQLQYTSIYPYCFGILGDVALQRHRYDEAIDYYNKTRLLDSKIDFQLHAIAILQPLSEAYERKGDLAKALEYSRLDQKESMAFEKENSEKSLKENELRLDVLGKEKMIAEKNSQRNLMIALIVFTLLLLVLSAFVLAALFRNYQNKRKLNTQLESLNQNLEVKNGQLDKRNAENELLLREIHHRVKNNLEIVSGLLALQAAQIDHPSAQAVMQASQNRVLSMGIIHQKLYQKDNLAAIEMKDYFLNLGESILDSFNMANRIEIISEMPPVELDVDTAVPVGLIANELLCNAMKYAFKENEKGIIKIGLQSVPLSDDMIFCLSDNGIGKPENASAKGTGFGTELVNLLVQQLDGKLAITNNGGTQIKIKFKYAKHLNGQPD